MSVRLTPEEIEECEAIAAEHGIPFLLDHLGLDGLGNEVAALQSAAVVDRPDQNDVLGDPSDWYR